MGVRGEVISSNYGGKNPIDCLNVLRRGHWSPSNVTDAWLSYFLSS